MMGELKGPSTHSLTLLKHINMKKYFTVGPKHTCFNLGTTPFRS